jgi:hypothetical protein
MHADSPLEHYAISILREYEPVKKKALVMRESYPMQKPTDKGARRSFSKRILE